jgi:hypothetical protein
MGIPWNPDQPEWGLSPPGSRGRIAVFCIIVVVSRGYTTAKKERGVLRAINKLGGLADAQDLADHWNASSKVGEIEAFMAGMCDRFRLRRRNTSAGTKYEKATDGHVQSEVAA